MSILFVTAYVYILNCSNGQYHIGCTRDLKRRIQRHGRGRVLSTKQKIPIQLVGYKKYSSFVQVRKQENYLKRIKNKSLVAAFVQNECIIHEGL